MLKRYNVIVMFWFIYILPFSTAQYFLLQERQQFMLITSHSDILSAIQTPFEDDAAGKMNKGAEQHKKHCLQFHLATARMKYNCLL